MGTILTILIVVGLLLWMLSRSAASAITDRVLMLGGAKPSYVAKGWFHHSLDSMRRRRHAENGIKSTLALYKHRSIVRIIVHNKPEDIRDIAFEDIEEVRYRGTENGIVLLFALNAPVQIGQAERDDFVLGFGRDGSNRAGSVHEKLRDWLDPHTIFVFEFQSGEQSVERGGGEAMRA